MKEREECLRVPEGALLADLVLSALARQRDLYREMLGVVQEHERRLAVGDEDSLDGLVQRRQRLLGQVESVERTLAPLRGDWDARVEAWGPAVRAQLDTVLAGLKDVLARLIAAEDRFVRALAVRRAGVGAQLKRVAVGAQARAAYHMPDVSEDRHAVDRSR